METEPEAVIEEIFRLARDDEEAALVAPMLERAYREGRWSAEEITAGLATPDDATLEAE